MLAIIPSRSFRSIVLFVYRESAVKICYCSFPNFSTCLSVQCQSTLLILCFVLEPRYWRIHLCEVIPAIVYNICLVYVNSVV